MIFFTILARIVVPIQLFSRCNNICKHLWMIHSNCKIEISASGISMYPLVYVVNISNYKNSAIFNTIKLLLLLSSNRLSVLEIDLEIIDYVTRHRWPRTYLSVNVEIHFLRISTMFMAWRKRFLACKRNTRHNSILTSSLHSFCSSHLAWIDHLWFVSDTVA